MPASRISKVVAHPLRATLPKVQRTSQGDYPAIEIVVVEIETEDGTVGFGEGLCRRGAAGYARFIEEALVPRLIGRDAADRRALWKAMRAALSGRPGGQIVEAIAAVDIALWDIAGKQAGQPIHQLLGGMGRSEVAAYASSINWLDDATVEAEVAAVLKAGFREIKVKLGHPLREAIARAKLVRKLAGDDIALYVDANWAYDVDDALIVGRALADLGYGFFEEPIAPQDREGYRRLAQHLPIRLAAGESDFVASDALISLQDRSLGLIQPDVTRSGGISETWRICELAAAFNTAYAPHVGWSGAICVAASLQLAAAAETFRTFECMVYQNPLRDAFTHPIVGEGSQLVDGKLSVPQGPGLGIEIDREALARFRIA
ncbi:mandelate racemase/muconate lactonizing enzyme family protein [Bosea sp. (in: a-proteobacteria)]|jgi:galactonate dehydratase|uniref:mandelate racemase/muconate lactonizing enzyme family protein n=1 Tax=Bosea sp. (in: a-proteobacteria) TaxID=1871050 RepID=UPI002DDD16B4|nr:mandelate racemase/muconate lactonizing enzyme family protein [Bosea sp. (in: a-proteobacteria)]HEV2511005.1 mandelate racemase/muconate lactonizing enzyme family protein [Bosea sp. (in: a-proteobacteria)]